MTRYIDADALKELFVKTLENIKSNPRMTGQEKHIITAIHTVGQMIDDSPTIDAAPIRKGTWTEEYDPNADLFFRRRWRCSACNGWNTYGTPNYCPDCGAEMTNSTKKMKEANHEQTD